MQQRVPVQICIDSIMEFLITIWVVPFRWLCSVYVQWQTHTVTMNDYVSGYGRWWGNHFMFFDVNEMNELCAVNCDNTTHMWQHCVHRTWTVYVRLSNKKLWTPLLAAYIRLIVEPEVPVLFGLSCLRLMDTSHASGRTQISCAFDVIWFF